MTATEAEIQRRTSRIVSSVLSIDEMLAELIGLSIEAVGCDACLVYLLDREQGELVLRASQLLHRQEVGNLRLKLGEGITGWVAEHREPVAISRGAWLDPRFRGFSSLQEDTYEAFLSIPLINGGELTGILNVHHQYAHRYTTEEIRLLIFVGEQIGGAIVRSQLHEELKNLRGTVAESAAL